MWRLPGKDRFNRTARRIDLDDRSFQSVSEADLYIYLKGLLSLGEITELKCQDNIHLSAAKFLYKPDFRVTIPSGDYEWHEMKGFETDTWKRNRRLWKAYGPGKLTIWKKNARGIFIHEIILPQATP